MKRKLLSLLLVLVLAGSLIPASTGTARAEKPVIDTITITSNIEAPIIDCYPEKPEVTISPSQVDRNTARFDWMKRADNGAYEVASYDLVTDGKYRFRYGLRVDSQEAELADSVTVIINGQPQTVNEYVVENGIYYLAAYSDVYSPQMLPKVPGSVALSPDTDPIPVDSKVSCVFSDGAENLDPASLYYNWDCQETDTGRIFQYQTSQGLTTITAHTSFDGYLLRARIYAKGYSGYLYSSWTMVGADGAEHKITVNGGHADKTAAKKSRYVTITADKPADGQVFDHWEVTPADTYIAGETKTEAYLFMPDEDVTATAVFRREDATHTVNVGALTVRDAPDGARIGGLTLGDAVKVVETQGDWSKIEYQGDYGWVMSKYLTVIEDALPPIEFTQPLSFDPADLNPANGADVMVTFVLNQKPDELYLECQNEDGDWVVVAAYGDSVKQSDTVIVSGNARENSTASFRFCAVKNGESALSDPFTVVYGSGEEPKPVNPFTDVSESDPFYDAVLWAYYATPQITNGITETTFGPKQTVTRGQCVTFLWRAMGEPEPTNAKNPFVDVPASQYYYKAVLWAVEKGITDGVDDTHFAPDATLSTAHIITFLFRTLGIGSDGWYQEAANWAIGKNLLADTGLTVDPKVDCPRSSVVLFLYRTVK